MLIVVFSLVKSNHFLVETEDDTKSAEKSRSDDLKSRKNSKEKSRSHYDYIWHTVGRRIRRVIQTGGSFKPRKSSFSIGRLPSHLGGCPQNFCVWVCQPYIERAKKLAPKMHLAPMITISHVWGMFKKSKIIININFDKKIASSDEFSLLTRSCYLKPERIF